MNTFKTDTSDIAITFIFVILVFLLIAHFKISNHISENIIEDQVVKFKRSCLNGRCVLEIKIKNKNKNIYTPNIENISIGDTITLYEYCTKPKGTLICNYKLKESE